MPITQSPVETASADPPPIIHPMDPRRGENLSPMFSAFLCWLLHLDPMTDPAITNIAVCGRSVLAATTDNSLFDAHLGSLDDFERNLRGWGNACGAEPSIVEGLIAKVRRAGR